MSTRRLFSTLILYESRQRRCCLTFSRRRRRHRRHLLQHSVAGHLSNMTLTALSTSLPILLLLLMLCRQRPAHVVAVARSPLPASPLGGLSPFAAAVLCGSRTTRYRLWRRRQQQQHVIYSLCFCNSVFGLLFSARYALAERFCCFLLCLFFFFHLLGCFFLLIFSFSLLSSFYSPLSLNRCSVRSLSLG